MPAITDEESTIVIYRTYPEGDVIALFPCELGTFEAWTCNCYQHIGQHGSAHPDSVVRMTRPATTEEIAPLSTELESIGYKLIERQRLHPRYYEERQRRLKMYR